MTLGIEKSIREDMLVWLGNIGAAPTRPVNTYFIQWHTGDPGVAGTANIASTAFTGVRDTLAGSGTFWEVGTADDGIIQNVTAGESAEADGAETISHFSIWSLNASGVFFFSGSLTTSQAVTAGGKLTYAANALTVTMTGAA